MKGHVSLQLCVGSVGVCAGVGGGGVCGWGGCGCVGVYVCVCGVWLVV